MGDDDIVEEQEETEEQKTEKKGIVVKKKKPVEKKVKISPNHQFKEPQKVVKHKIENNSAELHDVNSMDTTSNRSENTRSRRAKVPLFENKGKQITGNRYICNICGSNIQNSERSILQHNKTKL